jgi:hypothetical protein
MRDGLNADFGHHDGLQRKKELEDLATEFSSQGAELGVDKQRNTNPPGEHETHRSTNTWELTTLQDTGGDRQEETVLQTRSVTLRQRNPYLLLRQTHVGFLPVPNIQHFRIIRPHLTHHMLGLNRLTRAGGHHDQQS